MELDIEKEPSQRANGSPKPKRDVGFYALVLGWDRTFYWFDLVSSSVKWVAKQAEHRRQGSTFLVLCTYSRYLCYWQARKEKRQWTNLISSRDVIRTIMCVPVLGLCMRFGSYNFGGDKTNLIGPILLSFLRLVVVGYQIVWLSSCVDPSFFFI